MAELHIFKNYNARWVWPANHQTANQYIQFRQEFSLDAVDDNSQIAISTDTSYSLWLNGCFVHYGQFHDWPSEKTYDILNIGEYLKAGKNVVCVLAYYQGENSAKYIRSEPGIVYALTSGKQTVTSGLDTYWRQDKCYRAEGVTRITLQMHFSFEYDGRAEDNWLATDYMLDSKWQRIQQKDINATVFKKTFGLRLVKQTKVKERLLSQIITQGYFKQGGIEQTIARRMQKAFLSYRDAGEIFDKKADAFPLAIKSAQSDGDGIYLIADLKREEAGLFELEIDTDAGMIVDIAYGEHLEDMRVRSAIGVRNFANRYIAKQGRQIFTHYFTRFAGRYIQLHISGFKSGCTLHYVGLREVEYPIEEKSAFNSCDQLQNAIYKTAVRTLRLSMHEHYEDCPWREQALYANDARNQALCGYYCFGEYNFPSASFDLLGKGLQPDGYLELCAPADLPITIPSFTMAWIMALADHLLYSGDINYAAHQFPVVKQILNARPSVLIDDLLPCPQGARYWHFYDWASGLDGTVMGDCTKFAEVKGVRFDAPLNMFFCLALESAAFIARHCGDEAYLSHLQSLAAKLKKAIHARFFDAASGRYLTYAGDTEYPKHYAELTQSLAVLAKICTGSDADKIRGSLADDNNQMVKTTLSQSLYKFEALFTDKSKYGKYVFDKINVDWGGMVFKGATSFWETLKGASDFDNAGSLCHGWSAIPVYFYYAHLLGIRPIEPGFKKFVLEPALFSVDNHNAHIATPSGVIKIKLQRIDGRLRGELEYPRQLDLMINSQIGEEVGIKRY